MADMVDRGLPSRRSIRLRAYDYGAVGAYFVTLCTRDRACLFGDIVDDDVRLSAYGQIVNEEWAYTELLRSHVVLDAYVVMPNHFHGIIVLTDNRRAKKDVSSRGVGSEPPRSPSQTLGAVVRGFKAAVTYGINVSRHTPGVPVWQRNYYEHVMCDATELERVRAYIANNPARWAEDRDNPSRNVGPGR